MAETYDEKVVMVRKTCTCGGIFAITQDFQEQARRDKRTWFCPYCGGVWSFKKSAADIQIEQLQRERDQARQAAASAERSRAYYAERNEELHSEKKHLKHQVLGYKGHIAKTRKALRSGHCPCCGDFLKDLHRHMARKHPDYEHQPDVIGSGPDMGESETGAPGKGTAPGTTVAPKKRQ